MIKKFSIFNFQFLKKIGAGLPSTVKNGAGFTLIELLVVISIIGILAGLTLSSYSGAQKQARDTQRKADLTQLKTALEAYYSARNAYPSTGGAWRGACGDSGGNHDTSGPNGYIPNLAPTFVEELPKDPRSGQFYNPTCGGGWAACYLYRSIDGTDYKLLAHCGPETGYPPNSPFFDPSRPTWAWQVHSSDVSKGW